MDRRKFLTNLGIGAAVCAVVPLIDNTHEEKIDEHGFDIEKVDARIKEHEYLTNINYYKHMGFMFPKSHYHYNVASGEIMRLPELTLGYPRVL